MSAVLFLAAIGSFLIGLFGLANIRSDIQVIIALLGILGASSYLDWARRFVNWTS
jgi:type IV secretory pathway VirB2 component (pilin)